MNPVSSLRRAAVAEARPSSRGGVRPATTPPAVAATTTTTTAAAAADSIAKSLRVQSPSPPAAAAASAPGLGAAPRLQRATSLQSLTGVVEAETAAAQDEGSSVPSVATAGPHDSPAPTAAEGAAAAGGAAAGAAGVAVDGVDAKGRRKLYVRFDGEWCDLTAWAASHPAGSHWIEHFNGRDASEVFHAFHSDHASKILSRMPRVKDEGVVASLEAAHPQPSRVAREFAALRARLQREGWFERDPWKEAYQLGTWALCAGSGIALARSGVPLLQSAAVVPLALSFVDCCWLAHDYIHGRGWWCSAMRHFGGWAGGFGATMWSEKHNMHHAATNVMGHDEDLSGGPLLWLWAPDPSRDKPWRKYQHMYVGALFSLLLVVWRIDSVKVVKRMGLWGTEGLPILVHYALALAFLPWSTYGAAVLLGGFILANIVTCTHQSEELMDAPQDCWVEAQFRTTRDAVTATGFTEWLWGGMQYQLPHHLFPTMPRYRYPALRPVLEKWAKEQGLEYRQSPEAAMIAGNYANYRRVAALAAVPGAPASKSGSTI